MISSGRLVVKNGMVRVGEQGGEGLEKKVVSLE